MKQTGVLIEVAAFTPNAALTAFRAGAHRIELCSGYTEGGLSPSPATIIRVRETVALPLHVMVRPRIGDFIYNGFEKEIILRDIHFCKEMHADGVVAGALTSKGEIDTEFTMKMVEAAYPMSFTFHRAFDMCIDLPAALESLVQCGITRVLTSGGKTSCLSGFQEIAGLLDQAGNRIIVMPGGGINSDNLEQFLSLKGIREIHLSGKKLVCSTMEVQGRRLFTDTSEVDDFHWFECDAEEIVKITGQL